MLTYREIVTYSNLVPVVKFEWYEDEALDAFWLPPKPPLFYPRSEVVELLWCRFLGRHVWVIHSKDWNTKSPARVACCVNCGLTRIEILQIA
jgi:hypothetical protein